MTQNYFRKHFAQVVWAALRLPDFHRALAPRFAVVPHKPRMVSMRRLKMALRSKNAGLLPTSILYGPALKAVLTNVYFLVSY